MRHIQTDVLVIGGGATGTGVIRDLAMRGFKCILVEKRDLAYGTTGRYHGLLHSGGRYVVKDPLAARECIEENRILRKIMPQCIEDTGGYFVLTPYDDLKYIPQFLNGCQSTGIPVEQVPIDQMLKDEPLLNPQIQQCFRVPDASADSFLASDLNAVSARQYGAQVFTYYEVLQLFIKPHSSTNSSMVTGALCHDLVKDEDVHIYASMVVNASGAWAGIIAKMAGINLQMLPGKGTMLAVNNRVVNTIINRCKLPSDGDILVPAHTVAVIGTTDIRVADPEIFSIEPWEIRLMLDEGEKIIPNFKQFRILRAWAGVRPLIQEALTGNDRDISRVFSLLDHAERDGIGGFITITGGKWTTYRKMAETTVDKVCEKLNSSRSCRTHLEVLPSKKEIDRPGHYLGARLEKIEKDSLYGCLICECELATRDELEQAIIQSNAKTLDDIRRDIRLGMGPCQGAFCSVRAAGIFHGLRHPPVEETNASLKDFLEERWKGNLPILWGQQVRQERFTELIYISNLNINKLPGESKTRFSSIGYIKSNESATEPPPQAQPTLTEESSHKDAQPAEVVVIGAGLSGLIGAWQACLAGLKTKIITKGWGTIYWSTGCIDILGYKPPNFTRRITSPTKDLNDLIKSFPDHPYSLVGKEVLEKAIDSFMRLCEQVKSPYYGSIDTNLLMPTALGSVRPTCLAPLSMIAGDLSDPSPMLIVGFDQFLDFYPQLIADNLNAQGFLVKGISLDLKSLQTRKFTSGMVLARLFDEPEFRREVIDSLKIKIGNNSRIGFPSVLGLNKTNEVLQDLETSLGVKVFEIPGLPPSIPGIRLHNLLVTEIEKLHGAVYNGMLVTHADIENHLITNIVSDAAARQISHPAKYYILATGGILGGGITTNENGYAKELVFDLPIKLPPLRSDWFNNQFCSHESHPIHTNGVKVDFSLHPVDDMNQMIFQNLYAAGTIIGNCDPLRECSLEGIALATGFKIGESLSKGKGL
jgi:glycerol-3-phosphate dehydrogenase